MEEKRIEPRLVYAQLATIRPIQKANACPRSRERVCK
jgi:hypothetical protein